MSRLFGATGISLKALTVLASLGLIVAICVSLLLSRQASSVVSSEIQSRIVGIVFDSVAAGPVAFARLQSSSIATEQLARLMETPGLQERGIDSVRITSGKSGEDVYANWNSKNAVSARCTTTLTKSYKFTDAINPFNVEIRLDHCRLLPEQRRIFHFSSIIALIILGLSLGVLLLAVLPMLSSISRAEKFLSNPQISTIEKIYLSPVRKLVETAVRAADLEKNAAVLDIATQVSHDIRSPLGALNMAVSTLKDIPEDARTLITKATARINQISNDLLQSAKADRSGTAVAKQLLEKACISQLLTDIYEEKRIEKAVDSKKKFKLDLSGPREATAQVDRKELSRALSNLINNAFEAINIEGTVTVALRSNGARISVIVSDDGTGIDEHVLKKLGRERITFGKTGENSGTGRGVFHAQQSVEAVGGKLGIQSRRGVGTIITLSFPRTDLANIC